LEEETVLSDLTVIVDWRQRFMKAGARYDAENRGSLLERVVTSRVVPPSSDGRGRAPVSFC
jgi:hypothetical protein